MSHSEPIYTSDLTDIQWERLQPLLGLARTGSGRPIELDMRQVMNAIFYVLRTGCQWDEMPREYPNHNSVYYHISQMAEKPDVAEGQCGPPARRAPTARLGTRTERGNRR